MKTCSICGLAKYAWDFQAESARKDGLRNHCRSCERARARAYYERHAEQRRAYQRAYGELQRRCGVKRKAKQSSGGVGGQS